MDARLETNLSGASRYDRQREATVGIVVFKVGASCRTGEDRDCISTILGFPACLYEIILTISLSEFMLEDRDDRDWGVSASLLPAGGPNSTRESESSSPSEREPSSSLDKYHSWGSAVSSPFSSAGELVNLRNSVMTSVRFLEDRLRLLCGKLGGFSDAADSGRLTIEPSNSASMSNSA